MASIEVTNSSSVGVLFNANIGEKMEKKKSIKSLCRRVYSYSIIVEIIGSLIFYGIYVVGIVFTIHMNMYMNMNMCIVL